MIEHFVGSESSWAIWSYAQDRTLRDLSSGTFTGLVYIEGGETEATALTGTFTGAAGAGAEPTGTPNLTYTPASNEAIPTGDRRLRVVWSNGDTVVFDGPITVRAQVTT
jgi:hypothetical protein